MPNFEQPEGNNPAANLSPEERQELNDKAHELRQEISQVNTGAEDGSNEVYESLQARLKEVEGRLGDNQE